MRAGDVFFDESPVDRTRGEHYHIVLLVLEGGSGIVVTVSSLEDQRGRRKRRADPRLPVMERGEIAPFVRRCEVRILDGLDIWKPHYLTAAASEVRATMDVTGNAFGQIVDAVLNSEFSDPQIADLLRNAYRPAGAGRPRRHHRRNR